MLPELVQLRHALHREPEIGLDLPRTQARVLAALEGLPLEITLGRSTTSITAVLRGGRPGPAVLLRGDMDALPVVEKTGLPFASQIEGAMHACGHDLHTTMLVGAARLLSARREELAGDVVFMFQPGEEGWDGAGHMVAEGVLDAAGERVIAAYALHVYSGWIPTGTFATRAGAKASASDAMYVTVRGVGGHGSRPYQAKDPVPAACEMVLALQSEVTRRFDVFDPVVVTVGSIHGGTRRNVIPDEVTFEATIRSFSPAARERIATLAPQVCRGIAAAHELEAEIRYEEEFPVLLCDPAEVAFARETVGDVFGPERFLELEHPMRGSEDFSRVLGEVPGCFLTLGAVPPGNDLATAPSHHSPTVVFHDGVLADGAALHAELAIRRLAAAAA